MVRVLKCEFMLIPTGIKWYWGNLDLILRETLILSLGLTRDVVLLRKLLDHVESNLEIAYPSVEFLLRKSAMKKISQCEPDMEDPEKTGSEPASEGYVGAVSPHNWKKQGGQDVPG
ncbi:MAG: hypothetical protein NTAFB09_02040 [Nitrosospira sp.]